MRIVYRAGKENKNADALSRSPVLPAPQVVLGEEEVQVSPLTVAPCSGNDRPESRQTSWPDCLMATHPTISECTLTTELSEDILTHLRGLFAQHQGERDPGAEGDGFADLLQQEVGEDFQQGQKVIFRLIPADPQTATFSLTPSLSSLANT